MTFRKKLTTAFAAFALVGNLAAPVSVAFATDGGSTVIQITGNGANSTNGASVAQTQETVVSQKNDADVKNDINVSSNTGNNSASKNTGGNSSIDTGDSKTVVDVKNELNSNVLNVDNCNCDTDALIKVANNGYESDNSANLELSNKTVVAQENNADVKNKINADSSTGDNELNKNTGGDNSITTGNAWTGVQVSNEANSNWANVGGNGNGSTVDLIVTGNGAETDNNIDLYLDRDMTLQQYNNSDIANYLDASANTGWNEASKNTGGDTSIDTGNAKTAVLADTAANFNWANVDCDCLTDVYAKVDGNGYESDNAINAELTDSKNIFQENACGESWGFEALFDGYRRGHDCVTNDFDAFSNTGENTAKKETGYSDSDPAIETGNSETVASAKTSGNSNVYGSEPDHDMPSHMGGVSLNFTFNLSDLLGALGVR